MKSIVEEASSIKQAIENGWKRLGEPTIFSVKILERPETGFLGFSIKSAKVALIVEDKTAPSQMGQQFKGESAEKPLAAKKTHVSPTHQEAHKQEVDSTQEQVVKWSDQRIAIVEDWLKDVLKLMGKEHVAFEMVVNDATLHITFKSPLLFDAKNERFVLASMSHLIMETLRNKSKKIVRNMRIVISGQ